MKLGIFEWFWVLNNGLRLATAFLALSWQGNGVLLAAPLTPAVLADRAAVFLWPGQSREGAYFDKDASIATDRPNFTTASTTVGRGVAQLELGYTYAHSGVAGDNQTAHYYPEGALRYGVLANWLELRLGQSLVSFDSGGDADTELDDTLLGTKIGLTTQYGVLPRLAIVAQLALPFGTGERRADHARPGAQLMYYWDLWRDAYLTGTTRLDRFEADGDGGLSSVWSQSTVFGYRASERIGLFMEWFGLFQDSVPDTRDALYADCGLTYLVSNDVQLDIRIGSRLQDRFGEEIFSGAGVSFRR